ncbi:hypothetical protein [Mesorhizobium helmanticense]|nr:hypothetical protein [Mesorhizobium helmanticense]
MSPDRVQSKALMIQSTRLIGIVVDHDLLTRNPVSFCAAPHCRRAAAIW